MRKLTVLLGCLAAFFPLACFADMGHAIPMGDLTHTPIAPLCLAIFCLAYLLVALEEVLHLRKSKPTLMAAGLIWMFIAYYTQTHEAALDIHHAVQLNLLEYAELFLFLLVAMTYVNALEERGVFQALQSWLIKKKLSYRQLFWATGFLAFFISPIADNLTTALFMCAVVMALGRDQARFVSLSCINIVVAANAGGAFSPFGDITTLMVWQDNVIAFSEFFTLFLPSLVNFVVPALCMHYALPKETPSAQADSGTIKTGGLFILGLFLLTIITAISFHNTLHLPAAMGMMMGLSYLQFFGYYLKKTSQGTLSGEHFDVFEKVQRAEWDTLLFFYGIMLCVGGLATIGYLDQAGNLLYNDLGQSLPLEHQQTPANILIGIFSAIVDNIPVMFAVLTIHPDMSHGQWLLVTLTAGVGGSLLSVGSAAGVALMGQAKGQYTFLSHLKWTPAIMLGYFLSIATHLWLNSHQFSIYS